MSFLCPFIVINGSSTTTITDVKVRSKDSGKIVTVNELKPGEATPPNNIYQNGNQHWYIDFKINGKSISRHGKECGFRDNDNNHIAMIILYPENFSVITPQSNGCTNNHY
ncbi:hypothetical protein [Tenacibaculum sp. 190524A05c]|uniref:hypothetical protein n=1 Tax=Tenacibaculum platacis TaxID=3137852 RepID=UPI0032B19379